VLDPGDRLKLLSKNVQITYTLYKAVTSIKLVKLSLLGSQVPGPMYRLNPLS
jgi:hypothetical protein